MKFYLGTHQPRWLNWPEFEGVPLFVSAIRLRTQKRWPKAVTRWALDSGGFSALNKHGRWDITPEQYVADVRRWFDQIGPADWVAPMDWMCEPFVLAKTGNTVRGHQHLTVESVVTLRKLAPELPIVPVLQGWEFDEYLEHIHMYGAAGIDLTAEPLVGVGSVCRRQDTTMAEELMRELHGRGIKTHGFGFKLKGLTKCAKYMTSSDSLAWSYSARKNPPLPGCTHAKCNNCDVFARTWRLKALRCATQGEAL